LSAFAVRILSAPATQERRAHLAMELARVLAIPFGDARVLLDRAPANTPRRMDEAGARELVALVASAGAEAEPVALGSTRGRCGTHAALDAEATCTRCEAPICSVCRAHAGTDLCQKCLGRRRRRTAFRNARIGVLLGVLAIVLLYAWHDVYGRRERVEWTRTLDVALVVLRHGPVDPAAIAQLRARSHDLATHLAAQMHRYRQGPAPFEFTVAGPIDIGTPPPSPAGDGIVQLARHQYELWRYLSRVDARAGVDPDAYDSRIYLVVEPPHGRRRMIEGESEEGGRVGVVSVDLGRDMVDFALFVATHELFHTLGASDRYDSSGHALVPQGLGNPDLVPLYPQRTAEVMARNVVLAPGRERPPDRLAELAVGRWTAREIGWLR
jgi:hypothetical protein